MTAETDAKNLDHHHTLESAQQRFETHMGWRGDKE